MEPRRVQMPPMSFRADLGPKSIDDAARTVELIFTTGAAVQRMDWWTGERYIEVLSLDPAHVRLDRLNDGAPLLDSHSAYSVADQLGAVVPGSVALHKKAATLRVRFSKRDQVEPVWQDVRDGLIRSVSVGYRVHKFEETVSGKDNKLPIRTATDWEPFEVSMVPIPADPGAKTRGSGPADANPCEIVTRAQEPDVPAAPEPSIEVPKKEQTMRGDDRSETIAEPIEREATPPAKPAAVEPNERDAGAAVERTRCQKITAGCRSGRLPQSFADDLIERGVPLVDAQTAILAEIGKRETGAPRQGAGAEVTVVGDDPFVHKRNGIESALLHRMFPKQKGPAGKDIGFELSEVGRQYRGLGLMDIAEIVLRAQGVRITGMSKIERAGAALMTRAGMHSTSDFPNLLADVANKLLRAAYEEAPQTWRPIAQSIPTPDFKLRKMLQIGDAPNLDEILEHGEFTDGTIAEGKEQFQLKTYGKIFRITRTALVNDDLNAFAAVPAAFGRAARRKESDLAWAQITANAAMGDSVALFHATHGNLAGSGAAIDVTSIGAGRAAMRLQKGLDGTSLLALSPAYLIVPAAKETLADQFVSATLMAAEPGKVNPFAGRLQVIAEPRLDANSGTAWYLACAVSEAPTLFYGTLDGQEGPAVDQELGFDIDGLKLRCRLDVGFKSADWHAIYKNPGA